MRPRRSDFLRAFLRCFAIQGSWNYRTYLAGGLAYALLPLLRRIHAGDPVGRRRSLESHLSGFNGHPYLAPLAVGALARAEHEGRPLEETDRFRTALAGPLGAVGDRLVWTGWRPACLAGALGGYALGLGLWAPVLFLLLYNAGHVGLRLWAFLRGWRRGRAVAAELSGTELRRAARVLSGASVLLLGGCAVLLALRLPESLDPRLLPAGAAVGTAIAHRWRGAAAWTAGGLVGLPALAALSQWLGLA